MVKCARANTTVEYRVCGLKYAKVDVHVAVNEWLYELLIEHE